MANPGISPVGVVRLGGDGGSDDTGGSKLDHHIAVRLSSDARHFRCGTVNTSTVESQYKDTR